MLARFTQRIAILMLTVIATSSAVFALIHAAGDPTQGFMAPGASPEARAAVRERLGLDEPIVWQYLTFIGRGLRGDFGDSWRDRQPALNAVLDRLPATLELTLVAIVMAVVVGSLLAFVAVSLRSRGARRLVNLVGLIGQAIPGFWLGTLLILIFAVRLRWLPASGSDGVAAMILPAITLAAYPASMISRLLQTGLLEASAQPYARTARAKGVRETFVMLRHALPNALVPALGFVGVQLGFLVGGTVVTESVFAYPGIGRLALQAASERDLPVVHAFAVIVAIAIVGIGIVIDLITALIDPRLRETPSAGRTVRVG